jgi:hypothetical protein
MTIGWVGRTAEYIADQQKPLVQIRDVVLAYGALLYLVGFVVWSVYAWGDGLGVLPLLSAQYILAGLTVGLSAAIGYALAKGILEGRKRLHAWLTGPGELRRNIKWGIYILSGLCILLFFFSFILSWVTKRSQDTRFLISVYGLATFSFLTAGGGRGPRWLRIAFVRSMRPCHSKYLRTELRPLVRGFVDPAGWGPLAWMSGAMFVIFIPMVCLLLGLLVFLSSPLELGGARPSCSYLDVDRAKMAKELREELLPVTAQSESGVSRSLKLDVLFSGGSSVMVQLHEPRAPRRIYELSSQVILARSPCDQT